MKTTLFMGAVTLVFSASSAFAGVAIDKLQAEAEAQSVFVQTTSESRCPEAIQLQFSRYKPEWALPDDKLIYLGGERLTPDGRSWFTHEGNSFLIRSGLSEGKTHVLNRDLGFVLGAIYSVASQREEKGVVSSEYSAKIATTVMVGISYYSRSYDANQDQITYRFEGNGVSPVYCEFKKKN